MDKHYQRKRYVFSQMSNENERKRESVPKKGRQDICKPDGDDFLIGVDGVVVDAAKRLCNGTVFENEDNDT